MGVIPERDINHAKCSTCNEYKEHVDSGIITPTGLLIFVADKGTPWLIKGKVKTCPDCVDKKLVNDGKPKQKIPKELLKFDGKPRICKDCDVRVLPTRRAMFCEFCRASLSLKVNETEIDDEFIFSESGD